MNKPLFRSKATLWSSYLILFVSMAVIAVLYLSWQAAQAAISQVDFTRSGADITATATPANGYELKFLNDGTDDYWLYSSVTSASACNSRSFGTGEKAIRDAGTSTVGFTLSNPGTSDQYLCLKVLHGLQNNVNSYLEYYASFLVDRTAPTITVSQSGTTLKASSDDASGITGWRSSTAGSRPQDVNSNPDCSNESYADVAAANISNGRVSLTLTLNEDNQWYCFEATDSQGNVGYSTPMQVDVTPPVLTIAQENALITVSVSQTDQSSTVEANTDINVQSWRYVLVNSAGACQNSNLNWRALSDLSNDINQDRAILSLRRTAVGKHYCFRVDDDSGNRGYGHIQIGAINEPPLIRSVRQVQTEIRAEARDNQYINKDSWRYAVVGTSSTLNCEVDTGQVWQSLGLTATSSSSTRSARVIDLTQVNIDESSQDKSLCLRVADNLANNYGYQSINVDATAPTVTVGQQNAVLTARAGTADRAQSSTWRYVSYSRDFTCNATAFETYSPLRAGSRLTLTASRVGDYFCFRVADQYSNIGYSQTYHVRSLDTTAPRISASQNNQIIAVSAAASQNIDEDTWGYARISTVEPEECDGSYGYFDIDNRQVELTEFDVGYWFCIRAADTSGNYGYHKIRAKAVDATVPVVEVTQSNAILRASTTATDVNAQSWQYAVSPANQDFDCSAENRRLSFNQASASNNQVVLTTADNGRYYCFRVADKSGNHGYGKSAQIGQVETAPVIKVVQSAGRLDVSSADTDVDGLTWGWAVFNYDPGDCSLVSSYTNVVHEQITSATKKIIVRNIGDSQTGNYYCFRVADTSTVYGVNYGYAKHRYDLRRPAIDVSFNANTNILTVSSRSADLNAVSWRYAKFAQQPDCEQVSLTEALPANGQLLLQKSDNNHWLCFKVADNSGNYAYAIYAVSGVSDRQVPVIEATQTPYVLIATSASPNLNNNSWRYAVAPSEPYCGDNNRLSFTRNSGALNQVDLTRLSDAYNWVCFKVSNTTGQTGYLKVKIDRTAPTITVVQNNVALEASSQDEDLAANTWGYAKSATDFDCDQTADFTNLDYSSHAVSIDLTAADSDAYYCFRVSDRVGHTGYKKVRVNPLDLAAPVIHVTRQHTTLKASAKQSQANTWQYLRSAEDVSCSQANDNLVFNAPSAGNNAVALSEADNGYWFCFKVLGNNQKAGYAKILVDNIDSKPPVIIVKQEETTVSAQADEDIATWEYVALESAASKCDQTAFADSSQIRTGNQFAVSGSDGQTYCFRAIDSAGNASYEPLTVTVVDEGPTTTAPADDQTTIEQPGVPGEEGEVTTDYTLWWIGGAVIAGLVLVTTVSLVANRQRDNEEPFDDDYIQ